MIKNKQNNKHSNSSQKKIKLTESLRKTKSIEK